MEIGEKYMKMPKGLIFHLPNDEIIVEEKIVCPVCGSRLGCYARDIDDYSREREIERLGSRDVCVDPNPIIMIMRYECPKKCIKVEFETDHYVIEKEEQQ